MIIRIVPDKEGRLTQWDKDRKVIVTGLEGGAEVHFASPGDDHGAYVVELTGGEAAVPNILLTMAGVINVYVYPADRTVFAAALPVMAREKPDDYIYTETEVLSYKTLDEKIGDLSKLTTAAKENLVAAINEAATKGTAAIYMRVADGFIEYSGDGATWEKLIAVDELKGPKGDPGEQGPRGEPGEKGDKGDPGKDAATDISLGITSAAVGDIVKVKAVDANGKPTEWETTQLGGGDETWIDAVPYTTLEEDVSVITHNIGNAKKVLFYGKWRGNYADNSLTTGNKRVFVVPSADIQGDYVALPVLYLRQATMYSFAVMLDVISGILTGWSWDSGGGKSATTAVKYLNVSDNIVMNAITAINCSSARDGDPNVLFKAGSSYGIKVM